MSLEKIGIANGPDGVRSTLLYMKEMVRKADTDRIVRETAAGIIKDTVPRDHLRQVKLITGWVRSHLHYIRDAFGVEELTNPVTVLYNIRAGKLSHSSDCDDYAILLSALLRSVGFPTRLEAIAVNGKQYDHARVSVWINGYWVPIEGTRNTQVGYGLPSRLPIMAVEV